KTFRVFASLLLLSSGFVYGANKPSREQDRQAIAKAEADFEKARADRGLEGWLSFFAEDTADFVRGGPFTFTKEQMRTRLQKNFEATHAAAGLLECRGVSQGRFQPLTRKCVRDRRRNMGSDESPAGSHTITYESQSVVFADDVDPLAILLDSLIRLRRERRGM